MQIARNRTMATMIALFLISAMAFSLVALPDANAQVSGEIASYAYIFAAPNPVGVGQTTYITMWVDIALPEATVLNDIRRTGYKLTITKPDGTTESFEWPIIYDSTSIQFMSYTPNQVGTYTLKFDYAGQVYTWNATAAMRTWTGLKLLPATKTATLTVQQEPIPDPTTYPLPTEYWTRPIEGQNRDWSAIASHWLGGNYFGTFNIQGGMNLWQRNGVAPNSAHIMWTKPIEFGGVVGGPSTIPNTGFYSGGSYEGRFVNTIIMNGRLYCQQPLGHSGSGGGYVCADLRTGETIWYRDDLNAYIDTTLRPAPSFGQLYEFEAENQHGVVGGMLWQTSTVAGVTTWQAFDPFTGKWLFNLTNVPSGTTVYTAKGEIVIYVLDYARRRLALWNNTAAPDPATIMAGGGLYTGTNRWRPVGKSVNASAAYSWNVTIPDLPGLASPAIVAVLPGDIILGRSSADTVGRTMGTRSTPNPYTAWALSDKPATRGQLLWIKNYSAPAGNISRSFGPVDPVNRVWTMTDGETMQWLGYSLDDGRLLWGPTKTEVRDIQLFGSGMGVGQRAVTAYGNIYVQGFGGELFCYSTKNGTLLWKYNNTDSGRATAWGLRPIFIAAIADGKVYAFNNEHSPNYPLYLGNKAYCIDAYTGKEIWTMLSWVGQTGGAGTSTSVLAEGCLVYYNYYDNQIYCIGKGPSATTVSIQNDVITHGNSVLIKGTVTDISAGTKQKEQAARFPNGVPAVSDESMSAWMEYVYMQKPRPANATGVEVTLDTVDPNGNWIHIGTVTSDSSGMFKKMFTPEVPGEYTVIATFAGSESYWPSYAETAIGVEEAPPATPPPEKIVLPPTETYILYATVAIIIAVAIVGILMLRKRP